MRKCWRWMVRQALAFFTLAEVRHDIAGGSDFCLLGDGQVLYQQ
jgi:hypothetical protein